MPPLDPEHQFNFEGPSINVLDHGFVRRVDFMGDDRSVVRAARVSHDAAWRAGEDEGSDARLIKYLWRNEHTTPFEAVTFTFEVKAPIFVLRQWHRHRTWSYNEVSARYTALPKEFYIPELAQIQAQSSKNKQGRDAEQVLFLKPDVYAKWMWDANMAAFKVYQEMLEGGVARELARSVLPVATYSHMFATVNLLNLFRFLTLRCDSHAQYEIRVYADAIKELIRPIVPVCMEAFDAST